MAEVANKFNLDSTYFVAFEMAHEALRRGLEQASDLNITQYLILTKLMQASARQITRSASEPWRSS